MNACSSLDMPSTPRKMGSAPNSSATERIVCSGLPKTTSSSHSTPASSANARTLPVASQPYCESISTNSP